MDFVVFSLIVLIIKCNAGEIGATGNPHASSLSSSEPNNMVYYTAIINKPLDLPFHDVSVPFGVCHNFYDNAVKWEATISNSMLHVNNVTHSMSTLWVCTVFEYRADYKNSLELKRKSFTLYLNLHVKGAKSVEITVNGNELTFSEADLSAPYDGATIYFYEDGEHVQIVCTNPLSTGSVHLEYFTKGNDSSRISDSTTFVIELHSRSNSSYVDCVYSTTEPADTYVYRVTFVTKKRLFDLNESKTLSNVKIPAKSSSLILGSSIGAVLVILGLTGVACWYVRTKNSKDIETPYEDLTNPDDSPTPQCANENQYDQCHYSENLSNRDTYHETPGSVESNLNPEDHYYTKIDYTRCTPKIDTQTRNSKVYDEPYAHIMMSQRMQTLKRV